MPYCKQGASYFNSLIDNHQFKAKKIDTEVNESSQTHEDFLFDKHDDNFLSDSNDEEDDYVVEDDDHKSDEMDNDDKEN
jgi:hypothetical protein